MVGDGDDGVAIYNTGWRVVMIAILPLLGIATAVTSVVAAAFGAKSYNKLNAGFTYAVKIGLIIEIFIGIGIFLLAPIITAIFTTTPDSAGIKDGLVLFLRISCFFYPGAAFGIASSSMFQGVGKGLYALIATLLRTVVLTPILAFVLCCVFNYNLVGVWWALVFANLIGSVISYTWAKLFINNLKYDKNIV
jgi:Na+-driven multidrug efflux pump